MNHLVSNFYYEIKHDKINIYEDIDGSIWSRYANLEYRGKYYITGRILFCAIQRHESPANLEVSKQGYLNLFGNFYYKIENKKIHIYEDIDDFMWHRIQGASFKEHHEVDGRLLHSLILEKEGK